MIAEMLSQQSAGRIFQLQLLTNIIQEVGLKSWGVQLCQVTLMVIEMIPPLGALGVDRLYLGSTITGLVKMGVCICTCFIGGAHR